MKDISDSDTDDTEFGIAPVQVDLVQPVYPDNALNSGRTGKVWVKALIDTTGDVLDVVVVPDSVKNVEFEMSAINAAYKTTWKPATLDGRPVMVWVTYKVEFKLR